MKLQSHIGEKHLFTRKPVVAGQFRNVSAFFLKKKEIQINSTYCQQVCDSATVAKLKLLERPRAKNQIPRGDFYYARASCSSHIVGEAFFRGLVNRPWSVFLARD